MKKFVVFCLLMQLGKTTWPQKFSEFVKNTANFNSNFNLTQIVNGTNANDTRRKNLMAFNKLVKGGQGEHRDDYYDPYHQGGEKVFLWDTKQPPHVEKKKGRKTIGTTETPKFTFEQTNNEMQIYRDCNRDCPAIFQDFYGIVCGFRFNTMTYINEYREFNDLCELQYINCQFPESRPNWQLAHRGNCPELTSFRPYPTHTLEAGERANSWLDRDFRLSTKKRKG